MIREARHDEVETLIALWCEAGLEVEPVSAGSELIALVEAGTDLVLVDERNGIVVGTVLGTWDGRRGWVQRLAMKPGWTGQQIASGLVTELEERLRSKGCRKLNLLVERHNKDVVPFYERLGFLTDELIFMEKWL
jgi:ribosomal protein S18 acetylase RimI-like enzyme